MTHEAGYLILACAHQDSISKHRQLFLQEAATCGDWRRGQRDGGGHISDQVWQQGVPDPSAGRVPGVQDHAEPRDGEFQD